jgi:hypothetical protein
MQQNPSGFCNNPGECQGARSAMGRTAQALQAGQGNAQDLAGQAAEQLQQLDNALEQQQQRSGLSDAYRMQQMLDQQIARLREFESRSQSSSSSPEGAAQAGRELGRQSQAMLEQLRQMTQQTDEGTEAALQPGEQAAQRLAQAQKSDDARQAAGQLRPQLQRLRQSMSQRQPEMLGPRDGAQPSLRPTGEQAIARGLRQLESAARRQARTAPSPASPNEQRLRSEAARHLAEGVAAEYGHNEQSEAFLRRLDRDLKEPTTHVDMATVQQLLQEIQKLRREAAPTDEPRKDDPAVTNIDPSRFPPDYRRSIERYFEKLSEQR